MSSSDVLDESVTHVRGRAGHAAAVRVGEGVMSGATTRMVLVDDAIRSAAWTIFRRYPDVSLSLTDCTSIAVMRRLGMIEVFSFDSDFDKVGLIRRPR